MSRQFIVRLKIYKNNLHIKDLKLQGLDRRDKIASWILRAMFENVKKMIY